MSNYWLNKNLEIHKEHTNLHEALFEEACKMYDEQREEIKTLQAKIGGHKIMEKNYLELIEKLEAKVELLEDAYVVYRLNRYISPDDIDESEGWEIDL